MQKKFPSYYYRGRSHVSPIGKRACNMKQTTGFCSLLLAALLTASGAKAQKELRVLDKWMRYSDAPNALYHHLAAEAYDHLGRRSARMAGLHSLTDWQQRQQWLREALRELAGTFPEKTPLHVKVTGTARQDGYRLEHLVYESQPGFYVTGTIFIPGSLKKDERAPAVLYCSGHSATGYRSATYQRVILNLVLKGFVVFAFDPVGQGERLEYLDAATGKSRHKWPSNEHSYPGAQVFLNGNTLAMYMIWDGIRAVDLLLTRKEVDPQRIGITGRSGGGTQCAYIAAFDDRIKAAAPENYITNFTRLFESVGPQDAEQHFFNGIARGTDMGDLLAVRAPKPCLMITTTRDMFSIQGAMETATEVSGIYAAYGRSGDFRMVTDDAPHASTKKNREALYKFFRQYLDLPGAAEDLEVTPLAPAALQVTPTGQVSTSLQSETIFSLNRREAAKKHDALQAARSNLPAYLPAMLTAARKLSGYREPADTPAPVLTGRIQKEGYVIEKAFVKGEGDYVIPYLLMKSAHPNNKAVICLNPAGKQAGGEEEWLVRNGFTVLAPDMIGTGETGPGDFTGDSYIDSVSYNLWFASIQIGRSITGIRSGDVALLARLLERNAGIKEICGLAHAEMAPVLLHAAAFGNRIARIALLSPSPSYHTIVTSYIYNAHFIQSAVAGATGVYDLPDLAASLAPRKLLIAGATDAEGNPQQAMESQDVIQAAYRYRHAEEQLKITAGQPVRELLQWWIKD